MGVSSIQVFFWIFGICLTLCKAPKFMATTVLCVLLIICKSGDCLPPSTGLQQTKQCLLDYHGENVILWLFVLLQTMSVIIKAIAAAVNCPECFS